MVCDRLPEFKILTKVQYHNKKFFKIERGCKMIYGIISIAALLVGLLFGYIISKNSIQKRL